MEQTTPVLTPLPQCRYCGRAISLDAVRHAWHDSSGMHSCTGNIGTGGHLPQQVTPTPQPTPDVEIPLQQPVSRVPQVADIAKWGDTNKQAEQPDTVKVKVTIEHGIYLINTFGRNLPDKKLIINCLPSSLRILIPKRYRIARYQDITACMGMAGAAIPNKVWANAIAQAIILTEADKDGAPVEMTTASQGGYLAMGNTLYQLQPVGIVKANQALVAMRKQARERIDGWEHAYKRATEAMAESILQQARAAEHKFNEEKRGMEEKLRQVPPQQFLNRPLRYRSGWQVGLWLSVVIKAFEYNAGSSDEVRWEVSEEQLDNAMPVNVLVWVPVGKDGHYNVTSIKTDEIFTYCLPHITADHACVSPGDAPRKLENDAQLRQLEQGLERAFSVVNLGSMYNEISRWNKFLAAFVPPELEDALITQRVSMSTVARRVLEERTRVEEHLANSDGPMPEDTNIELDNEESENWSTR